MWLAGSALYAVSALGGSVLVYLIAPLTATAGASGGGGLFGATFMVARRLHLMFVGSSRSSNNLASRSFAPAISWQGHVGAGW